MKKVFSVLVIAMMAWVAVPRAAEGGADPNAAATRIEKGSKGCKDSCFHQEAVCRGKRAACMAARQRCVKGCR